MKKHKKNICFYCEHPYSTKATFNRSKNSSMNIDERIYTYYKNKINRDNVQAKGKFKEFSLSLTDFSKLIHSDCAYCGAKPTSNNVWNKSGKRISDESLVYINGIDRINSDLGYTISNCVSCCPICNRMKLDLSVNEFYNHVEQIYKKRLNDQSKDVEASASKQESS